MVKNNNENKVPFHLGIIIDGNRRWARERGLPKIEGHRKGLNNLWEIVKIVKRRGVKILTLFIFSTENWNRSKEEVEYLLGLFKNTITENLTKIDKQGIKVNVVGKRDGLSDDLLTHIRALEQQTKENKEMVVNLAFNYGGRLEIVEAAKKASDFARNKGEEIDIKSLTNNLWIPEDVDLIIRTGKEKRISNFLIWQSAYAELYFSDKYWPNFSEDDLDEALKDYQQRERRFGR